MTLFETELTRRLGLRLLILAGGLLLVSDEVNAHDGYKHALVDATERDTALTMHTVSSTIRSLANEVTAAVTAMEAENPNVTIQELLPLVSGKIGREAYRTGEVSRGMLSAGHALGFTDTLQPMAEIIARLENEASAALGRLDAIRSRERKMA